MKALVIRDPWIELILNGNKTWEMRSKATNIRGRIALARKGSGLLMGTAELVDVRPALSAEEMRQTQHLHGIPCEQIQKVMADGWTTPWVLQNIQRFEKPLPYTHNLGAVTWVNLPESEEQDAPMPVVASHLQSQEVETPTLTSLSAQWVDITLTQGNIQRNHIPVRHALSLLPKDCIGGPNKHFLGSMVRVVFETGDAMLSDVAGDKNIFRTRGPVGRYFKQVGCKAGDQIRLTRLREYEFHVARVDRACTST